MNINDFAGKNDKLVLSFGDSILTGKAALCTNITINYSQSMGDCFYPTGTTPRGRNIIEVDMSFVFEDWEMLSDFLEGKTKVSKKLVGECSIQELLFAARKKII
jgi:hypothetical protein